MDDVQKIIDALNKELAARIREILKESKGPKKLEIVKHTPHEENTGPYYTIELDGKNCFPGVPLRSITTLEQAELNFAVVRDFKKPTREVIKTEEVDHE